MKHVTSRIATTARLPQPQPGEADEHWLARCMKHFAAIAQGHVSAWEQTLDARRRSTHPQNVARMREPVRATPRAKWYR